MRHSLGLALALAVAARLDAADAVQPQAPSAVVDTCSRVTASVPFLGDDNGNSTTSFSRGPSSTGPWSTACGAVSGPTPRTCIDKGVAANTTYYYQVDFTDADGVVGTDPQVIGPYTTPYCTPTGTAAGSASAVVNGSGQIGATAPFTGDADGDGSVLVEYNTSNTWTGGQSTGCASVVGASPRTCLISGLAPGTAYWVRVTYSDPDGVSGVAVQVVGSLTTTTGANTPPMILFLVPARNATVGGSERFKVQVYDPDGVAAANVFHGVDTASPASAVVQNTNYACNVGSQTQCKVFEFSVDTTALANGSHYVTVKATDSGSPAAVAQISWPIVVNNSGAKPAGAGTILRRTHGSQLCTDCHNLATHSSQATSFKYGSWANECLACHTPHSTANIYLVRPSIDTPRSGSKSVDFRDATTGVGAYSYATPQASGNGVNVCEVCHTRTQNSDATPRARNNAATDWTKHYSGDCRACHTHAAGFAGGGESGGNDDCLGCHKFGMAVAESGRVGTYHHVMEAGNNRSLGITTYPTSATPTVATGDLDKTCLQCHADHDVFRPDVNTLNTIGVGANLRTRIATGPPTGAPPPPSAPGDSSPGYYGNADANAGYASGGICITCHLSAQAKNTADQKSDTTTQTPAVVSVLSRYTDSAHAYGVAGSFTKGPSPVSMSCTKCHNSDTVAQYQNGTYRFTLHTSGNRRLLAPLGIAAPGDPLGEDFCFRCHSRTADTTPGGGPVKGTTLRDYYGAADMAARSERLYDMLRAGNTAYVSRHDVVGSDSSLHKPIEGSSAGDGSLSGANRHAECEDCHNPHAATPAWDAGTATGGTATSLTDTAQNGHWRANQWAGYRVVVTGGSGAGQGQAITGNTASGQLTVASWSAAAGQPGNGSTYRIDRTGLDSVSGATGEVWGVSVTPGSAYGVGSATFQDGGATVWSGASGGIVTTTNTGTAVTSDTRNWVTNEWMDYTMRMVTGTSAGQTRTVAANSRTQLSVAGGIAVVAGDLFVVYSTGATRTLYLKASAEESPSEPMPNAHAGADAFQGGTWIGRSLSPGAPAVSYETETQATGGGTAPTNWRMATFTSPAIATAGSLAAANWTFNLYVGESAGQQNAFVRYMVHRWNANDTLGTTICARANSSEIPVSATPAGAAFSFTCAGAALSFAVGDKVVVDLELQVNSTNTYTANYWFGAGAAANVVMPAPLDFGRPDPRTPTWTIGMVGGHIRNELDRNGRWYRITSFSQPDAGQAQYSLGITPSYSSSGASPLSDTRMTNSTAAPTAQWYMDYGTSYGIAVPTLTRTASATKEYEVCVKCHSPYAYGDSPPTVPSGHQDGGPVAQTNVVADFNNNQLGHHPIFAIGRNQPTAVTYAGWNTNAAYTRVDNTGSSASFGLSNTFTTGWYKESLVRCSDCHSSDSGSDPLGPHASGKKWVLNGLDTSVSWVRRNAAGTGWETITNASVPSGAAAEARNFCLNCHRWDVYGCKNLSGNAPAAVLSRVSHDVTANQNTYKAPYPASDIVCNQCHGGDRIGGIHGSNRGRYPYRYDPSTDTNSTITTGPPQSYSGKRLLNGAYWYGVTRATTSQAVACWGKGGTDTVSLCAHSHAGDSGHTANYSYDDTADP